MIFYQNFAKSIGQLVEYPRLKGLENFPYINVLERKPSDKSLAFGGSWLHQDTSYLEKDRPRYTMLMGIEIPVGQGNTIFSSGFNAYKNLPNEIKQKIVPEPGSFGIFSSWLTHGCDINDTNINKFGISFNMSESNRW